MMTAGQHAGLAVRQIVAIGILLSTDPTLSGAQINDCSLGHSMVSLQPLSEPAAEFRLRDRFDHVVVLATEK